MLTESCVMRDGAILGENWYLTCQQIQYVARMLGEPVSEFDVASGSVEDKKKYACGVCASN